MTTESERLAAELGHDRMLKPEALAYWLQYEPRVFFQAIVPEIRERIKQIEHQIELARPAIHAQPGGLQTPEELCEAIQPYQDELKYIMDVLCWYIEAKNW